MLLTCWSFQLSYEITVRDEAELELLVSASSQAWPWILLVSEYLHSQFNASYLPHEPLSAHPLYGVLAKYSETAAYHSIAV